jgi:hypothetical protein
MMSKAERVAELLFAEFETKFPLADVKGSARVVKPVSSEHIQQRLAQFYKEAREVRKAHRLWLIGWARAVRKLQQRMLHAGHPPALVSKILLALVFSTSNER